MNLIILTKGINNTSALIFINTLLQNKIEIKAIVCEEIISNQERKKFKILKYFNILKILNRVYSKLFFNKVDEYSNEFSNINEIKELKEKVYLVPNHNSDEVEELLNDLNADVILVLGTRILEERIFSKSKIAINFHSGIVPMYKGSYTVFWAMRNQDWDNVGYVFHEVASKLDSGEIIFEKKINVDKSDDERSVFKRIEYDGAQEIINVLKQLDTSNYSIAKIPQVGKEHTYKGRPSELQWFMLTLVLIKRRFLK
jgi:methionyl-tRNA formyltransferase